MLLLSGLAQGEVYKCTENGKATFQDKPCAPSSTAETLKIGPSRSPFIGCYQIDFPGFESSAPHAIERWRVAAGRADDLTLESISTPGQPVLHMKRATADELKMIGDAFHFRASDGINVIWDKNTPSQKPVGLYRVVDATGGTKVLAYFFLANGWAASIPCS